MIDHGKWKIFSGGLKSGGGGKTKKVGGVINTFGFGAPAIIPLTHLIAILMSKWGFCDTLNHFLGSILRETSNLPCLGIAHRF